MALTENQIIELIKKPANSEKIQKCRKHESYLKNYLDGVGYKNPITDSLIDAWQSEAKEDLKKHMEINPTIPISKLIRDELNKGIITNNSNVTIKPENKEFEEKTLSAIWKDGDINYFINTFLKKSIDTDVNSFLIVTKGKLIEKDGVKYEIRDGIIRANDSEFTPYCIYISINDVHDFNSIGSSIDYIIYEFEKHATKKIYRVIDDEKDLLVLVENNDYSIIPESVIYHKLKYTPVKQISDLYLISSNIPEIKASQFSHVIGEFNSYFIKYKQLKTSEVMHAFPKYWSIGFKCPVCEGQKVILNPDDDYEQSALYMYHDPSKEIGETIRCPYCKGEGSIATINSKDVIKLPVKIGEDQFNIPSAPAGYVQFPRESLEYQSEKLNDLEFKIIFDTTGSKNLIAERLQTATEVNTNVRGLEARIKERQRLIESNVNFIANTAAKIQGLKIEYNYSFNRNISYKNEDILYEEIKKAIESQMPKEYIDELKKELLKIRISNKELVNNIENIIENGKEQEITE